MITATANYAKLISLDADGRPAIAGEPRYPVIILAMEHLGRRLSAPELHEHHPDLTREQIDAALAYYYDHRAEMDALITEWKRETEENRAASKQPTRAELEARLRR